MNDPNSDRYEIKPGKLAILNRMRGKYTFKYAKIDTRRHCSLGLSASSAFLSNQISISHQPTLLFSNNKSAPATSHIQPNKVSVHPDLHEPGKLKRMELTNKSHSQTRCGTPLLPPVRHNTSTPYTHPYARWAWWSRMGICSSSSEI